MNRLLDNVRVLDVSQIMAGPYCSMVLGDLGADVIKIEKLNGGDDSRQMGPYVSGESACFMQINRNKRGIGLNLKNEEALQIFYALAKESDVLIENFRPGVVKSLKIDYDTIKSINPRLIYCSISGFGQTGPYREKGGFDLVAQGMTGLMHMTGEPGRRPLKTGVAVYDIGAGLTAIYSILAAYIYRERTGQGQHIDVALAECGIPWFIWEAAAYFADGTEPEPTGWRHRVSAPYQVFATRNGYLTLGAANQRNWERFCRQVVKRPEWMSDERFSDNWKRHQNVEALEGLIEAELRLNDTTHWLRLCEMAGVPAGPVYRFSEMLSDEHYIARGMVQQFEHKVAGTVKTLGFASKFSDTPASIRRSSPVLGEHTDEILRQMGFTNLHIEELRERKIIS